MTIGLVENQLHNRKTGTSVQGLLLYLVLFPRQHWGLQKDIIKYIFLKALFSAMFEIGKMKGGPVLRAWDIMLKDKSLFHFSLLYQRN